MLADKVYLATLPVDPVAQKIEWEVVRNQKNEVIGVHRLSNGTPTLFAKLFCSKEAKNIQIGNSWPSSVKELA